MVNIVFSEIAGLSGNLFESLSGYSTQTPIFYVRCIDT